MRLTLDRDEVVTALWALEEVIENYKHDGGLVLAEKEMALHEKLNVKLRAFDQRRTRAGA